VHFSLQTLHLRINGSNFIRLVWRHHTKFQIGMAAALPAIPLPVPLLSSDDIRLWAVVLRWSLGLDSNGMLDNHLVCNQPLNTSLPSFHG